jgi:hypothetical protein
MSTNKMHFSNSCLNSILIAFYTFRISYVHYQEDYIVHAALYGMFTTCLCKQPTRMKDVHILQPGMYKSLPDDEHRMLGTCRRQEELN